MLKEQIDKVEQEILWACQKAGRKREEITLIAVSKTKPLELLEEAMAYGMKDFGENKVQEMTHKWEVLPDDLHWHFIGHLQRNKVKYIAPRVYLVHSVDSLRLAEAIHKEGKKNGRVIPILIEVNAAQEESKFGLSLAATPGVVNEIASLSHVKIEGLMTIAPFVENPEDNRVHFRNLYQLSVDIKQKNIDNVSMNVLSMGMTNDFSVAIEEGATMVRVGTAIFGERNYKV